MSNGSSSGVGGGPVWRDVESTMASVSSLEQAASRALRMVAEMPTPPRVVQEVDHVWTPQQRRLPVSVTLPSIPRTTTSAATTAAPASSGGASAGRAAGSVASVSTASSQQTSPADSPELQRAIARAHADAAEAQAALRTACAEKDFVISDLESQIRALQRHLADGGEDSLHLSAELEDATRSKSRVRQLEAELRNYRSRLADANQALEEMESSTNSTIAGLQDKLAAREQDLQEVMTNLQSQAIALASAHERLRSRDESGTALTSQVKSSQTQISQLEQDLAVARRTIKDQELQLDVVRQRESELSSNLASQDSSLQQLRMALQDAHCAASEWQQNAAESCSIVEQLRAQVASLEAKAMDQRTQIAKLSVDAEHATVFNAQRQQAEDLARSWRQQCEAAERKFSLYKDTAEAQLRQLRDAIADRDLAVMRLQEDLATATSRLNAVTPSMGSAAAQLQMQLDSVSRQLSARNKHVAELEARIAGHQSTIETLTDELRIKTDTAERETDDISSAHGPVRDSIEQLRADNLSLHELLEEFDVQAIVAASSVDVVATEIDHRIRGRHVNLRALMEESPRKSARKTGKLEGLERLKVANQQLLNLRTKIAEACAQEIGAECTTQ